MTEEECRALKKGDDVYVRQQWGQNNAIMIGADSLERLVCLRGLVVQRVNKLTVTAGHTSQVFADLISAADAQAAMSRHSEAQAKKAADARRANAAVGRIERVGFVARTHYAEVQVVASVSDVEQVERLADIIATGSRALAIMADVRAACPVTDAPMVTLHLSVEQAERALAALKGGATAELLDEVERLRARKVEGST
jgi:hypothetical protein